MVTSKSYLTFAELSAKSGLSVATLRCRVREGKLPFLQPGGRRTRVLFPADALDRLLRPADGGADSTPPPTSPPDGAASRGPRPKWLRDLGG